MLQIYKQSDFHTLSRHIRHPRINLFSRVIRASSLRLGANPNISRLYYH